MIPLTVSIPGYQLYRRFGTPRLYPANLTVSVTYRCNSRCRTCRIYDKRALEFSVEEYDKTFASIGPRVFWITMSGGEPFLRRDFAEICALAYVHCKPRILNIPTNGILSDVVGEKVEQIAKNAPETRVIVNVSLDEIEERHDRIRNVDGNYAKAIRTIENLKRVKCSNLSVGIHTVISRFNVDRFAQIYQEVLKLGPDAYITEIAEQRVELGTVGEDIVPAEDAYCRAIDYLCAGIRGQRHRGIHGVTQAFRSEYYRMVKRIIREKKQIVPCYAGLMSAHIAPDGNVWACCTKAESMGNLRDELYDFGKVWFSKRAQEVRKPIREELCYCPLANASYTNMLVSYPALLRVLKTLLASKMRKYF